MTPEEARFLAVGLEQAIVVAQRVRDDPDLLEPSDERGDEYLVRVQTEEAWTDEWLVPEPAEEPFQPRPDQERPARMRKNLPVVDAALETDLFIMPQYVKEKEDPRPYLAHNLLMVDAESGMIPGAEVLLAKPSYQAMWAEAQASLLQTMARQGGIPQLVAVRDARLAEIIAPIADRLGFEMVVSHRLPALEEARAGLEQWIR